MKKALVFILVCLMVLPLFVFQASAKTSMTADGFNCSRGSDQLIIYTPDACATTGTNDWGYEIVVVDNVITSASSAGDKTVPANGFVVSGHGTASTWLRRNAYVGSYVYYSKNGLVTISDSPISDNIFYSYSNTITGFNTIRGVDSLIVYNQLGKNTGTNDWGFEIVVTSGFVTSITGNNNKVPNKSGSFVVSAHGVMADWLREYAQLGMAVTYDTSSKTITLAYNADSIKKGMELELQNIKTAFENASEGYLMFDKASAETAIATLEERYNTIVSDYETDKDALMFENEASKFITAVKTAMLGISESRNVEYRAVWVRPSQTSASAVDDYVQTLYENGINTICLETLIDSCMIMPMPEDSLFEQNSKFKSFDILQTYIDSCHERGMELHVWMPVYYVGDGGTYNASKSIGNKKPEWLSVSNTGTTTEDTEGFIMLDPANKEATDFLLESYRYILETYDIDSFQLDYIRYYTRSETLDMGYSETALDAFEAKYGVRPEYNPSASYWTNWVNFRAEYISNFVLEIKNMIEEVAPDVLLGADVVPDATEAKTYNYQEYTKWLDNGWLDIIFPMAYNSGYQSAIPGLIKRAEGKAYVAVGLGIYLGDYNAFDMQDQVLYNNAVYADGHAFFESTFYMSKATGEALLKGSFRNDAITPNLDFLKAQEGRVGFIKQRVNDVLLTFGLITEKEASLICRALDDFSASFTKDGYGVGNLLNVKRLVNRTSISDELKNVILSELDVITEVFSINNKTVSSNGSYTTTVYNTNTYTRGDVNGKNGIEAADYALAKRIFMNTYYPTGDEAGACDANEDGNITALDYTLIKRVKMGTFTFE